jgi:hypothetical protein
VFSRGLRGSERLPCYRGAGSGPSPNHPQAARNGSEITRRSRIDFKFLRLKLLPLPTLQQPRASYYETKSSHVL